MKKTIIFIMMLTCFCMASKPTHYNPTHYFEGKWYKCYESNIKPAMFEKAPKCSTTNGGLCEDYDAKGNMIHRRDSWGSESWYEYNAKGNRIHRRDSNGYEEWYEYDAKGNKIHLMASNGFEVWLEYDAKGNQIHFKRTNGEESWSEHDAKGNQIHWWSSDGQESWYKWFFDEKNNKKYQCRVDKNGNPSF